MSAKSSLLMLAAVVMLSQNAVLAESGHDKRFGTSPSASKPALDQNANKLRPRPHTKTRCPAGMKMMYLNEVTYACERTVPLQSSWQNFWAGLQSANCTPFDYWNDGPHVGFGKPGNGTIYFRLKCNLVPE